jgi:hypothetical protein
MDTVGQVAMVDLDVVITACATTAVTSEKSSAKTTQHGERMSAIVKRNTASQGGTNERLHKFQAVEEQRLS